MEEQKKIYLGEIDENLVGTDKKGLSNWLKRFKKRIKNVWGPVRKHGGTNIKASRNWPKTLHELIKTLWVSDWNFKKLIKNLEGTFKNMERLITKLGRTDKKLGGTDKKKKN